MLYHARKKFRRVMLVGAVLLSLMVVVGDEESRADPFSITNVIFVYSVTQGGYIVSFTVNDTSNPLTGAVGLQDVTATYANPLNPTGPPASMDDDVGKGVYTANFTGNHSFVVLPNTVITVTDSEAFTGSITAPAAPTPEPSTIFLLCAGLAGLGLVRRRVIKRRN
jgi:hypothetical protein